MQFYKSQNRQFEADILTVGCIAGIMRMVIAIYRDLPLHVVNLDFIVDCSLCLIFLSPLILLRLKVRFEFIAVPFSFLMISFLCLNWIVLDGISGMGEYYFIGGMILIALINNGKWLVFFVSSCVLLEIGLLYIAIFRSDLMNESNPDDQNIYHYLWITIVVTIALLYHKAQFDFKRQSLRENKKNLELKVKALERRNIQLEEQKEMLQQSNDWLEKNITQRSEKLMNQRKSIEQYLSVTLFEIGPFLESTVQSIKGLDAKTKKTPMGSLLMQSTDHLQSAIQSVTNKVKQGLYYNPEN
ncbi:hypothetical protein SAMN04488029_0551 [Reichenbachiella faecimaris]|uniref:Uncharacterized protein n=1 Tax=Reichenbachiella faecimaris TaxID=692418 RepID=A0A1W2G699_REIFA|nr:hypothetical protein [Reichenbachiella faecimaris]SMD32209.1 hypothetical protein SAMN04488029_0551 [Reichenbachiella faecimaris]